MTSFRRVGRAASAAGISGWLSVANGAAARAAGATTGGVGAPGDA
jgi:hypothetical protein